MDEFAQSRGDDDLFDDDIVPFDPTEGATEVDKVTEQVQDISLGNAPKGPSGNSHYQRGYEVRGNRSRGRGGRGRGAEWFNPRQRSSGVPQPNDASTSIQVNPTPSDHAPAASSPDASKSSESQQQPTSATTTGSENQNTPDSVPPTEPATPSRPPAVRGDRTATGGIKKPKLTEAELTAKLAAAKTRSENLSAAHARAEADAASFAERERAAAEKRIKDAANRKVMEGERERNREKKMAVMGGREWDAEKNEEDFKVTSRGRGRGNYTRGVNGAVRTSRDESADDDLRQYQWQNERGGAQGQSRRRGRGSQRGAPRGRADHRNIAARQPDVAAEADFPSLPTIAKPQDKDVPAQRPEQKRNDSEVVSPTAGAGSWADQVESREAAKPMDRW